VVDIPVISGAETSKSFSGYSKFCRAVLGFVPSRLFAPKQSVRRMLLQQNQFGRLKVVVHKTPQLGEAMTRKNCFHRQQ
jgi:hypothetical protein